jgi:hypothetical protein
MSQATDDLLAKLQPYVDEIDDDLLKAFAAFRLDAYIGAASAYMNLIGSAASAYSNLAGSVSKRSVDAAKDAMDSAYGDFVNACADGGVSLPSLNDSVAYWSLT